MENGVLSVWLTTKWQAEDPGLQDHIHRSTNKRVRGVATASGEEGRGNYPKGVKHFSCPMYHKGSKRTEYILDFYGFCEDCAAAGDAVII